MPVCMYTYVYLFVEYPSDLSQCSFQRCNYILWPWTTVWSSRFHIFLQVFTQLCQPSHHQTTLHTQRLCMLTESYDTAVVQSDTSPNFSSVVNHVYKVHSMSTLSYLCNSHGTCLTSISHPAADPAVHRDGLSQACFLIFSTVCLVLGYQPTLIQSATNTFKVMTTWHYTIFVAHLRKVQKKGNMYGKGVLFSNHGMMKWDHKERRWKKNIVFSDNTDVSANLLSELDSHTVLRVQSPNCCKMRVEQIVAYLSAF